MPTCSKCKENKERTDFYPAPRGRDGLRSRCTTCLKVEHQEYRKTRGGRSRHLLKEYGITLEDYESLLIEQDGVCAICSSDDPGRGMGGQRLHFSVDHDHATGRVRGLLCSPCNIVIGLFQDDAERLFEAAYYLVGGGSNPDV